MRPQPPNHIVWKLAIGALAVVLSTLFAALTTGAPQALITFDHYHDIAEIEAYLEAVADRYGSLTELVEIGRSVDIDSADPIRVSEHLADG